MPPDWRQSVLWLRRAYLEGEFGLSVDENKAIEWANRARKARDG